MSEGEEKKKMSVSRAARGGKKLSVVPRGGAVSDYLQRKKKKSDRWRAKKFQCENLRVNGKRRMISGLAQGRGRWLHDVQIRGENLVASDQEYAPNVAF